eukprot:15367170-Ditylum_brightwellii.AAC.2
METINEWSSTIPMTTTVAMPKYKLLTLFIADQLTPTILIHTHFPTYIDLLEFENKTNEDSYYNNDINSMNEINFVDMMQFHDDDKADLEFFTDVEEHLFSNDVRDI